MPTSGNAYRPDGRGFPAPAEGFVGHASDHRDRPGSLAWASSGNMSVLPIDRSIAGQYLVGLQLV